MNKKNISREKIIQSFLTCSFEKGAGGTSLTDISQILEIKKASLYNHFKSREEMYDETLSYCDKEISKVSFLYDNGLDSIKQGKVAVVPFFKRLINRFYNIYETEPCFQIYVFIHTEKYFTVKALKIVEKQFDQTCSEIKKILEEFILIGKIEKKSEKILQEIAKGLASIIYQNLDMYISQRKETVRQNPESGAGSLFALPTDDDSLNKIVKLSENYLKAMLDL